MSSAPIDEDTARAINEGRATAGAMLSAAQRELQKVFIVFVMGLVGTIMVLRLYVWEFLRANTKSRMSSGVESQLDIIVRTPFDVILIQVKIGLVVGVLVALPVLLYYSRDALRARGFTSAVPVSRAKVAGFALLATVLFLGGVVYAYAVFFPFMFSFLASNAINAAIKPSYDIVMYIQFLIILTVSFGLAAQLPLVMSVLAYTEVVPYETFRDKWRYAVVLIFAFGAFFSPPDPFTQIMWGIPLCALYVFSLGLAKLVTNVRRAGASDPTATSMRQASYYVAALYVLGAVAAGLFAARGGFEYVNGELLPALPAWLRPGPLSVESVVGLSGTPGVAAFSLFGGFVVVAVVVFAFMIRVLNQPVEPRPSVGATAGGTAGGGGTDPADVDVGALDAGGVRAAPPEPFIEMTEEEALSLAQAAIDADDREKARAILDRFDEAEEMRTAPPEDADADDLTPGEDASTGEWYGDAPEVGPAAGESYHDLADGDEDEDGDGSEGADGSEGDHRTPPGAAPLGSGDGPGGASTGTAGEPSAGRAGGSSGDAGVVTSTAAGVADAFSEDETTEEDVGGYYYDIAFIFESLTSKAFRIVGVFMAVMGVSFYWLYQGGLGAIKSSFFSRVDRDVLEAAAASSGVDPDPSAANYIIALHPVEQLIFEVKVSAILGAMAALPMVLYYAWPALRERGLVVGGNRNVFVVWGGSLFVGAIGGLLAGFFYVAPRIISFLVEDALEAGMVISYRLNAFMWMVIFTTAGIGLLADVPVTMLLFHRGGIVSYRTMRTRWREVVLAIFAVAGFVLPGGVLTMLIIAIPLAVAYGVGLGLLWLVTLPGRLRGGGGADPEGGAPA